MKGMLFFIIGLIIVFGVFKLTQDNTSASDEMDKQEIKQELEKMGVEINPDDLEKVG
jgi:hypothetical protein